MADRNFYFEQDGWARDSKTGAWAKGPKNLTLYTNKNGYLWTPLDEPDDFSWPIATDAPVPGSYNYQLRHPTRYNWRSDVEAWARYLVNNYNVWCNTYYDHPETYWRDETSIDVWGPAGRNDPIDSSLGQTIFDKLFYYEGLPHIDWIIWNAWIWTRAGGWSRFGTDNFTWHYDHIHITYV